VGAGGSPPLVDMGGIDYSQSPGSGADYTMLDSAKRMAGDVGNAVTSIPGAVSGAAVEAMRATNNPNAADEARMGRTPSASETPPPVTAAPAQTQPVAPIPPKDDMPKFGTGPNTSKEMEGGLEDQINAENAKATALGSLGDEQAKIQSGEAERVRLATAQMDKDFRETDTKSKVLAEAIASNKIDPSHFWSSRTSQQKTMSIIAMILGGIGSGLTKQPNAALQMLNSAAERDVDAQKANLGKLQTQQQYYLQRGHSIQQSRQLAIADQKDITAGMLRQAAYRQASPLAQAAALESAGKLHVEASQMRKASFLQGLDAQAKQIQIYGEKQNIVAQKKVMEAINSFTSGDGYDQRVLELPAFKEYRERAVHLSDGSLGFAKDAQAAAKAQEQLGYIDDLRKPLQEYDSLYNGGHPTISPSDRGKAEALRSRIVAALGNLRDAGTLRGQEYSERMAEVPAIEDIFTAKAAGKLGELGRLIDDKTQTVHSSLSLRKQAAARQPLVRYGG
jgi:hypothetical protein